MCLAGWLAVCLCLCLYVCVYVCVYVTVNAVYLQDNANLNYSAVNTYTVQVTCSDNSVSDTQNLYVYITKNGMPTFLNLQSELPSPCLSRLVGLVVRCPPRERKIPGSNPACAGIFSGSSHTSDFKIGTPVATLPGAWRYRVSIGIGRPGVSIL